VFVINKTDAQTPNIDKQVYELILKTITVCEIALIISKYSQDFEGKVMTQINLSEEERVIGWDPQAGVVFLSKKQLDLKSGVIITHKQTQSYCYLSSYPLCQVGDHMWEVRNEIGIYRRSLVVGKDDLTRVKWFASGIRSDGWFQIATHYHDVVLNRTLVVARGLWDKKITFFDALSGVSLEIPEFSSSPYGGSLYGRSGKEDRAVMQSKLVFVTDNGVLTATKRKLVVYDLIQRTFRESAEFTDSLGFQIHTIRERILLVRRQKKMRRPKKHLKLADILVFDDQLRLVKEIHLDYFCKPFEFGDPPSSFVFEDSLYLMNMKLKKYCYLWRSYFDEDFVVKLT
jgi:hypothetical protein